jgi:acyl dehydratase
MPINPDYLLSLERPAVVQRYDWRDAALFALGLGYGDDPLDKQHLSYLDTGQGMQIHPAMANVLCYDGGWLQDPLTGIDYLKVVHGEQEMDIHHPLPLSGTVSAATRIEQVVDKGLGKGALVTALREIRDAETNLHYATVRHSAFCRGVGGGGGLRQQARPLHPVPERASDQSAAIATLPNLALIYRLSGDLNPLHSDPQIAREAGFDRPILHGLSTFGIAVRALLGPLLGNQASRVRKLAGRFSAPVYPGETISVEWWADGAHRAFFAAHVGARSVLQNGVIEFD